MERTSDMAERARRARQAAYVFLWFLDDATRAQLKAARNGRLVIK